MTNLKVGDYILVKSGHPSSLGKRGKIIRIFDEGCIVFVSDLGALNLRYTNIVKIDPPKV